jgi:hypothetical protein
MAKCEICGEQEADSEMSIGNGCELNYCENCKDKADSVINTKFFCYQIHQLELGKLELKEYESYSYENYESVGLIGDAEIFYITSDNKHIYFLVQEEKVLRTITLENADDDAAFSYFNENIS